MHGRDGTNKVTSKLAFDQMPQAIHNVRHIGSLVFDKRAELGPAAFFDLTSEQRYPLLARDLVAALYEHVRPSRIGSDLTVRAYATAIREVLTYCSEMAFPSSFRLIDLSREHVLDYRSHLNIRFAAQKSSVRRRRFGCLLRLIQAASSISLAPPECFGPRNFPHIRDSDRTQPYPAGELLDLEGACRTDILKLATRLERGKQLLAEGVAPGRKVGRDSRTGQFLPQSPSERSWIQLPNLLWYVVHVLDGQYLKRAQLMAGHTSFNNSLMGVWGGEHRKADVYSYLYPSTEDLIPFVLLLVKTTGRNESSILNLRRDCVQQINGRYVLWYTKNRGAARTYKKGIANDGPFSPVQLIRQVREITEPLVRLAPPEVRDQLLLGLAVGSRNPVQHLDPCYLKFKMNREAGWCDARDLKTESGRPLRASTRRLRVNYLTDRYRRTGHLGKVSRDAAHTHASTTIPYLVNDATKHIHEEAVERGIRKARSLATLTVIAESDAAAASEILKVDESTAARILSGEQDVFIASCRDFYNRPGGKLNTPCDKPWECLFCPNAVITTHVLPRVVKFRDFIRQQRSILSDADWNDRLGKAWQVLHRDILPRFSADALAHAERLAADEVLYIPLGLKS